jgi:hypothetical protein
MFCVRILQACVIDTLTNWLTLDDRPGRRLNAQRVHNPTPPAEGEVAPKRRPVCKVRFIKTRRITSTLGLAATAERQL